MENKWISTSIIILLVLYASLLGPNLPPMVQKLFDNVVFRIVILFFILFKANDDPSLALVMAIAFVMTLDYIHRKEVLEAMKVLNNK